MCTHLCISSNISSQFFTVPLNNFRSCAMRCLATPQAMAELYSAAQQQEVGAMLRTDMHSTCFPEFYVMLAVAWPWRTEYPSVIGGKKGILGIHFLPPHHPKGQKKETLQGFQRSQLEWQCCYHCPEGSMQRHKDRLFKSIPPIQNKKSNEETPVEALLGAKFNPSWQLKGMNCGLLSLG